MQAYIDDWGFNRFLSLPCFSELFLHLNHCSFYLFLVEVFQPTTKLSPESTEKQLIFVSSLQYAGEGKLEVQFMSFNLT